MISRIFFILTVGIFIHSILIAQKNNCCPVHVAGAMYHVMWDGQLSGTIDLDTITNKDHLYGLGPLEYLAGELLVLDGKSYKSAVQTGSEMIVEETYNVKAPFFVYANVARWKVRSLPHRIQTLTQLETYLDHITQRAPRPFAFKLTGFIQTATLHIVNLPEGTSVHAPVDAHQGSMSYQLKNQEVIIAGFFSTQHQAIFTHHDSYVHAHLITTDKSQMGHVDEVHFGRGGVKLYLPKK
ncbi:MAG TPA: acetolactate decarboxylase [Saprospiraceae bacterium]|nr:acetolactate decarboxylase [Saprospiraceae bacterium]